MKENNRMNGDGDVKKLKDLVKKLEQQNQHLRYKTGKLGPRRNSAIANDLLVSDGSYESNKTSIPQQNFPALDDSIDKSLLKSIHTASDTCWLFSLDNYAIVEDRQSLEAWLRYDLDYPPTAALSLAKKNIISSLDGPAKFEDPPEPPVKTTVSKSHNHSSSKAMEVQQNHNLTRNEVEEDFYSSPHIRHMPLPSHTTASTHSLVPTDLRDCMHRNQSPSRSARQHMPLPSRTTTPVHNWPTYDTTDTHYSHSIPSSEKHIRHRSPSPGQRNHRSPSPSQRRHRSPSPDQRSLRSPSPSYPIPSQSSVMPLRSLIRAFPVTRTEVKPVQDQSPSARRIPAPSTPLSGRSTTALRKEGALTPRMSSTEKPASDRSRRNNSGLYSSRASKSQSGIPSRKSGVGLSKGSGASGGRQPKYLRTTELRGAVSSKELYPESSPGPDEGSGRSRSMTPRRSLPRPSRTTKSQYSTIYNGRGDSVRSLELQRPESIRSDSTASEASDVWKEGEFF